MSEVGVEPAFVAIAPRAEASPSRRIVRVLVSPFAAVSWVLVRIALGAIAVYKKVVSPLLPPLCRFEPTCSQYFAEALVKKGLIRGSLMGIYRLLRCQPLCKGGYDPVD